LDASSVRLPQIARIRDCVRARTAAATKEATRMQRVATFFGSTIGKKVVMGVTGVVLFGFVWAT
jgi:hypothetical protein